MSILDISLLIILAGFVINGLSKGLINLVGRILGLFVGVFVAGHFHAAIFYWAREVFNILAIIPGSKYLNNLAGAALGFLEGALFLGLIIFISSQYAALGNLLGLGEKLGNSVIVPILLKIVDFILPFLPEALRLLKTLV